MSLRCFCVLLFSCYCLFRRPWFLFVGCPIVVLSLLCLSLFSCVCFVFLFLLCHLFHFSLTAIVSGMKNWSTATDCEHQQPHGKLLCDKMSSQCNLSKHICLTNNVETNGQIIYAQQRGMMSSGINVLVSGVRLICTPDRCCMLAFAAASLRLLFLTCLFVYVSACLRASRCACLPACWLAFCLAG